MNRLIFTLLSFAIFQSIFAQTDTTGTQKSDTVRVGNFIIIKEKKDNNSPADTTNDKDITVKIHIGNNSNNNDNGDYSNDNNSENKRSKTTSTNYFILDLGFANFRDKTDYGAASAYLNTQGGAAFTSNDLDLNTGKSTNVNFWLFMQKLNVSNHVANLKYGLGIEMYNFRYKNNISYTDKPPSILRDSVNFSKNKLFVDYITVPLLLNLDPTPDKRKGFSLSAGVSAGYKIGSRNKQISGERGKQKTQGDFNLDPWRFAYVAEIGLGPVRLYGSYSINALHQGETGLKQYPYVVGLRLSNW